jgi:outer membrane receptor for ferrienterochelin and colicins
MDMGKFFCLFFLAVCFFPAWTDEFPETQEDLDEWSDLYEDDEGITITGTRSGKRLKDTPVITEIITAEEIAGAGSTTVDEVLRDEGLMYWSNAMGDYVTLQGMEQGRVLYLIDGKRLAGRVGQRLNGQTLPLGRLDRVEIVRGPQSLQYGSEAIGGVINFITKRPTEKFGLTAGIKNRSLWSYNDPATEESPGPFDDFYPFREQIASAGMDLPLGPLRTGLSFEGSRGGFYYNEDASASILGEYYRLGGRLDTVLPIGSAELRAGGSFFSMKNDDRTSALGSLTENEYLRAGAYLEAEFSPFSASRLILTLYDSFYDRSNDAYTAQTGTWTRGERDENENLVVFESLLFYDVFSRLLLTAGFEAAYNSMEHYDFAETAGIDREAVFVEAEYYEQNKFSVLGGIRAERNSQFGFTAVPKISAMYHLNKRFRVFGGGGMGYRAPSFNELYREYQSGSTIRSPYKIESNTDISPEYALSFDAGIEYVSARSLFQVNSFYTELFDEIITVDSGRTESMGGKIYRVDIRKNINRSLRTGINAEGRVNFLQYFFTSAGYSWLFAWNRSESLEIHDHPAHSGKLKLGFNKKWQNNRFGVNTYAQGNFFSPRGDGAYEDDDPRWTLDFHLNFAFGEHFVFRTSVNNVTGNIYRFGPDYGPLLTLSLDWTL